MGRAVIELLEPKAGERDTRPRLRHGSAREKELAAAGCTVVGTDSSPEMVEAARNGGKWTARLADAQTLKMDEKFDAVLSNDALHWMPDQYAVVRPRLEFC